GPGHDYRVGGTNRDLMVGDNYGSGEVSGGNPDRRVVGNDGNDTLVGDSFSTDGDATGSAGDHLEGASGDDRVIGDDFAPGGTAKGGGDDEVNGGPGADLQVGDSYTQPGGGAQRSGGHRSPAQARPEADASSPPASGLFRGRWWKLEGRAWTRNRKRPWSKRSPSASAIRRRSSRWTTAGSACRRRRSF